jgi:hypothetical protein
MLFLGQATTDGEQQTERHDAGCLHDRLPDQRLRDDLFLKRSSPLDEGNGWLGIDTPIDLRQRACDAVAAILRVLLRGGSVVSRFIG